MSDGTEVDVLTLPEKGYESRSVTEGDMKIEYASWGEADEKLGYGSVTIDNLCDGFDESAHAAVFGVLRGDAEIRFIEESDGGVSSYLHAGKGGQAKVAEIDPALYEEVQAALSDGVLDSVEAESIRDRTKNILRDNDIEASCCSIR